MEKWYSRFKRGDVWFLHLNSENGDGLENSSVQKKSRPYLIVSCEENNLNSPTINVIPICTRDSDHLPMHVYYRYEDGTKEGRNQLILCEQITTVSVQIFNHSRSWFMYSLHLDLMNQVDEAITRQLGLKPRVADMRVLENLISKLAAEREAELKKIQDKEIAIRVEKLAEMLSKKFNIQINSEDLENGTEYRDEELQMVDTKTVQEMRKEASKRRSKQEKSEKPKPKPKKKRHSRWTEEEKLDFLADSEKLSKDEMAKKYNILKNSVSKNIWLFRRALQTS